jgi:short-subunit dehydrogenase
MGKDLAKLGFNIVLIGRSKEKLEITSKSLKEINPNVVTIEVEFDFSKTISPNDY